MGNHHHTAADCAATDIVLLFDRSASMSGGNLKRMQRLGKHFVDEMTSAACCNMPGLLPNGMRIGIVSYGKCATIDAPLISSARELNQAIDQLTASGKTNHSAGFERAWQMLSQSQARQKVILLFTDACAQALRQAYEKDGIELQIIDETESGGNDMYNNNNYNCNNNNNNDQYDRSNYTGSCTQLQHVECDTELENTGRVVQLDVTVRRVCPGKRVALGVMLYEQDENGNQEARGIKTMTIDAHHENCPRDVQVQGIEFVLPDDIALASPRRFSANVIAHHIDTDYQPCRSGVVLR